MVQCNLEGCKILHIFFSLVGFIKEGAKMEFFDTQQLEFSNELKAFLFRPYQLSIKVF